ncbi:hypothetical protein E2C01_010963 [Portunus trituberculatus]|uniref:Uncharacterized protein n=1 Tax=Portunus trituberculatus TaxID=210409 RepID=A0A5B7DA07_PORTR|nr:hypothetical protein [Portunus trituberculatus]
MHRWCLRPPSLHIKGDIARETALHFLRWTHRGQQMAYFAGTFAARVVASVSRRRQVRRGYCSDTRLELHGLAASFEGREKCGQAGERLARRRTEGRTDGEVVRHYRQLPNK